MAVQSSPLPDVRLEDESLLPGPDVEHEQRVLALDQGTSGREGKEEEAVVLYRRICAHFSSFESQYKVNHLLNGTESSGQGIGDGASHLGKVDLAVAYLYPCVAHEGLLHEGTRFAY